MNTDEQQEDAKDEHSFPSDIPEHQETQKNSETSNKECQLKKADGNNESDSEIGSDNMELVFENDEIQPNIADNALKLLDSDEKNKSDSEIGSDIELVFENDEVEKDVMTGNKMPKDSAQADNNEKHRTQNKIHPLENQETSQDTDIPLENQESHMNTGKLNEDSELKDPNEKIESSSDIESDNMELVFEIDEMQSNIADNDLKLLDSAEKNKSDSEIGSDIELVFENDEEEKDVVTDNKMPKDSAKTDSNEKHTTQSEIHPLKNQDTSKDTDIPIENLESHMGTGKLNEDSKLKDPNEKIESSSDIGSDNMELVFENDEMQSNVADNALKLLDSGEKNKSDSEIGSDIELVFENDEVEEDVMTDNKMPKDSAQTDSNEKHTTQSEIHPLENQETSKDTDIPLENLESHMDTGKLNEDSKIKDPKEKIESSSDIGSDNMELVFENDEMQSNVADNDLKLLDSAEKNKSDSEIGSDIELVFENDEEEKDVMTDNKMPKDSAQTDSNEKHTTQSEIHPLENQETSKDTDIPLENLESHMDTGKLNKDSKLKDPNEKIKSSSDIGSDNMELVFENDEIQSNVADNALKLLDSGEKNKLDSEIGSDMELVFENDEVEKDVMTHDKIQKDVAQTDGEMNITKEVLPVTLSKLNEEINLRAVEIINSDSKIGLDIELAFDTDVKSDNKMTKARTQTDKNKNINDNATLPPENVKTVLDEKNKNKETNLKEVDGNNESASGMGSNIELVFQSEGAQRYVMTDDKIRKEFAQGENEENTKSATPPQQDQVIPKDTNDSLKNVETRKDKEKFNESSQLKDLDGNNQSNSDVGSEMELVFDDDDIQTNAMTNHALKLRDMNECNETTDIITAKGNEQTKDCTGEDINKLKLLGSKSASYVTKDDTETTDDQNFEAKCKDTQDQAEVSQKNFRNNLDFPESADENITVQVAPIKAEELVTALVDFDDADHIVECTKYLSDDALKKLDAELGISEMSDKTKDIINDTVSKNLEQDTHVPKTIATVQQHSSLQKRLEIISQVVGSSVKELQATEDVQRVEKIESDVPKRVIADTESYDCKDPDINAMEIDDTPPKIDETSVMEVDNDEPDITEIEKNENSKRIPPEILCGHTIESKELEKPKEPKGTIDGKFVNELGEPKSVLSTPDKRPVEVQTIEHELQKDTQICDKFKLNEYEIATQIPPETAPTAEINISSDIESIDNAESDSISDILAKENKSLSLDKTENSIRIKTDHKVNRPDVMLHIPTQELIDFDDESEMKTDNVDTVECDSLTSKTVTEIVNQLTAKTDKGTEKKEQLNENLDKKACKQTDKDGGLKSQSNPLTEDTDFNIQPSTSGLTKATPNDINMPEDIEQGLKSTESNIAIKDLQSTEISTQPSTSGVNQETPDYTKMSEDIEQESKSTESNVETKDLQSSELDNQSSTSGLNRESPDDTKTSEDIEQTSKSQSNVKTKDLESPEQDNQPSPSGVNQELSDDTKMSEDNKQQKLKSTESHIETKDLQSSKQDNHPSTSGLNKELPDDTKTCKDIEQEELKTFESNIKIKDLQSTELDNQPSTSGVNRELPDNTKMSEDIQQKLKSTESDIKTKDLQSSELDTKPSTSGVNKEIDSTISEDIDQVVEDTDTLGLLAESSRTHDDDEEPEPEDEDADAEDDDDFDPDDESSNQMTTAEHSEDSNTPAEDQTDTQTVVDSNFILAEVSGNVNIEDADVAIDSNDGSKIGENDETGEELMASNDITIEDNESPNEADSCIKDVFQHDDLKLTIDSDKLKETIKTLVKACNAPTERRKSILLELLSKTEDGDLKTTDVDKCKKRRKPSNEQNIVDLESDTEDEKKEANKDEQSDKESLQNSDGKDSAEKKKRDEKKSEIFNLDSDEEGISVTAKPPKNNNCINNDCTSDNSTQYYKADKACMSYFNASSRRDALICVCCMDYVIKRNEALIEGIKDMRPLMDLDMSGPGQQLVEISDSDSEDESDTLELEPIGDTTARMLEKELASIVNKTWEKYDFRGRLLDAEMLLNKELQAMEEQSLEVAVMLTQCQKATDNLRTELYLTFETEKQELTPLNIYDTDVASFFCSEKAEKIPEVSSGPRYPKRQCTTPIETAAKKPAIALGYSPTSATVNEEDDQAKQDDDKDISVVRLSAEVAPADLPPPGELTRAPLQVGMSVYAMKHIFGTWLKGTLVDVLPKPSGAQFTQCKVKFEHKQRTPWKMLYARCIAYTEPSDVRMTIGTRLIALFKNNETTEPRKESYYSGVVAEIPNPVNNYRYLVFFDDGYAQYVQHQHTRLVAESSAQVWEEVHPFSRDFVYNYLLKFPERPMVRMHTGQTISVELNGKWYETKVINVDASLVEVLFLEVNRKEWIYRGSTRLRPLFVEFQAAKGGARTRMPRSTRNNAKVNMPYVEYTRSDEQTNKQPAPTNTIEEMRRLRAVAKKSTTGQAPPVPTPPVLADGVTSRVVYYTPKHAVRPHKLTPHNCGPRCKRTDVLSLKELRTYNPLAKPLLSGWERQITRFKGHREVMYRAPCGRRLRNMAELHRYLCLIRSDMSVDLFDFNPATHCLAEFVLTKYNVGKKDLSHGKENVPIACVNYYDNTLPEFCSYNTVRTPTAGVPLNLDPEFLCGCDCTDDCADKTKCACWQMTLEGARTIGMDGPDVGYQYRRLLEPLPTGIYECNSRCKCKSTCLNRVAQHPLQIKLQVFKTINRGWGIRALNDVPKGAFLCIYAGNLLTDATANLDGLNEGDEYLAELDYIEVVEGMKEGYEEDVVENDKNKDKKETESEEESEGPESEEEENKNKSDEEDDDFRPGYIGMGLTEFSKRLRRRDKKKDKDSKENKEKHENKEDGQNEKGEGEDCITISDDEEVREPARFAAQEGMRDSKFVSKFRSIRQYYGKDEACYIMDAKVQGNIGRYLNHSCSPNVFVQNVFVDTHDLRFPWVSFFALHHIRAGTELTWNYNYDIGSVPGKVLYCYCGAYNCRGRLL